MVRTWLHKFLTVANQKRLKDKMKKSISSLGLIFMLSGLVNAHAEDLMTPQDQQKINTSYEYCEKNSDACKNTCRKLGSQVGMMIKIASAINHPTE